MEIPPNTIAWTGKDTGGEDVSDYNRGLPFLNANVRSEGIADDDRDVVICPNNWQGILKVGIHQGVGLEEDAAEPWLKQTMPSKRKNGSNPGG